MENNEDDLVSFAPEDDNFSKAPDPEDVFFANEEETSSSVFQQQASKVPSSRYIPILPKGPNHSMQHYMEENNTNDNDDDLFLKPRPRKRRGENVYKCKNCGQLKKQHLCKQLYFEKSTQTKYDAKKNILSTILEDGDKTIIVQEQSKHDITTTNNCNEKSQAPSNGKPD